MTAIKMVVIVESQVLFMVLKRLVFIHFATLCLISSQHPVLVRAFV